MKRTNLFIALGCILALAAGVFLATRPAPNSTPRFAPLAPNGSGVTAGGSIVSSGKGGLDQETVVQEVKNDVSEPLRSITPIDGGEENDDADMNKVFILPGRGTTLSTDATQGQVDEAVQTAAIAPNAPVTIANFDGISNINGVLPPDTNGDVGPNHYMQWVNLSFAIYSKTGTLLYGPAAGNTLWSGFGGVCQTSNDGDPIVLYDHLADRWMVSQFAVPGGASGYHQCIAVSQTGDPTGAWYRYDFLWSNTNMNDYPHFGVWSDGYYMTVHEFANAATWAGQGVAVFERDKMLQGLPARMVKFNLYSTDPNMGGMLPSDLDGPAPAAGTPNYFVEPDDNAGGFPQDQVQIWAFHVDWTNTANSTFTRTATLATAAFDSNMCNGARACIPQSGTTAKLDAIADRAMYRAQFRDFGGYQTIVLNHTVDATSADRAGIRWYELRNTGGAGWGINQQSTFSPDTTQRWMGSIAMNSNGDIGLGYSASSSTMFPAIRYTGRLAADPLGSMTQGEGTLMAGTGAQTHTAARWGDYSMLSVDPVDDCTFWYTNEYVQTTGSAPWRTRIGSFKLANCGAPGPTPTPGPTNTPGPTSTPTNTPPPTNTPTSTPTNTPAPGITPLTNGVPVTNLSGGLNSQTNFSLDVPAGATNLSFTMSGGTGDADLYVSFGSQPTLTVYDCRPYLVGNNETCSFAAPQVGTYYVMVVGYSAYSGVSLVGSYQVAGPTATPLPTSTPGSTISTGFLAPSANAAVTTSAGDNNGYQTSPANAYVFDGIFATDASSGTNSNTSCTNSGKDKHLFYNYNFNIPTLTAVKGIEVKLSAKVNSTSSAPKICIQISWNGGTTWTTAKSTTTLTTTNTSYTLGTVVDTWGRTWGIGDFTNANFRIRVIDVSSSTARTFSLDGISVNITYQP